MTINERYFTVSDATKKAMELDKDATDYEFRLQAIIKRLVHYEKADLYERINFYLQGIELGTALQDFFDCKIKTHKEMRLLPDEEIITWDIATHKYKSKLPCDAMMDESHLKGNKE